MKYRGSLLSYPKFMILVEEEKRNGKYSHEKLEFAMDGQRLMDSAFMTDELRGSHHM